MRLLKKQDRDQAKTIKKLKEISIAICQDFKELQYCKEYFLVDTLSEKSSILDCQGLRCKVYAN